MVELNGTTKEVLNFSSIWFFIDDQKVGCFGPSLQIVSNFDVQLL